MFRIQILQSEVFGEETQIDLFVSLPDSNDAMSGDEEDEGSEVDESEEDDDESDVEDDDDEGGVENFSKVALDGEREKGEAVRCQLGELFCGCVLSARRVGAQNHTPSANLQPCITCYFPGLYDALLKGRIEVQKIVTAANQLPQPGAGSGSWEAFRDAGGEQYALAAKEGGENCVHECNLSRLCLVERWSGWVVRGNDCLWVDWCQWNAERQICVATNTDVLQ